MRHYQVRDVMTANPMTVTPATPLKNVADILVRGRIGVVPVLTPQGREALLVAEGDLLRKEQLQQDPEGRHSMHRLYPDPPGHRHRRDRRGADGPLPGDRAGLDLVWRRPGGSTATNPLPPATGEDGKALGVVSAR